jgi:hypothetical protein
VELTLDRFVYRDSIDENIVRLHESIAAGESCRCKTASCHATPNPAPNGVRILA